MLNALLSRFESKTLQDISKVSLLNRIDSKYVISRKKLTSILTILQDTHAVVKVDNLLSSPYKTLYYDTEDFQCYQTHHNGKRNRLKFRTREYLSSNVVFNEIKHKANTGKTYKTRINRSRFNYHVDDKFNNFIKEHPENFTNSLLPQLVVNYNRITLVDKTLTERVTIDTDLTLIDYDNSDNRYSFKNLIIVECKRERGKRNSPAIDALHTHRCRPNGFSKYCIGIALLKEQVKTNLLKEKIRFIEKIEGKAL